MCLKCAEATCRAIKVGLRSACPTLRNSAVYGIFFFVALHVGGGGMQAAAPHAAAAEAAAADVPAYRYCVPEKINDGWQTASLESENLHAEPIKDLIERIRDNTYKNIYSVLLVKNGKIVVEEYFPRREGDRREQAFKRVAPHEIHSATKSVNSILIGIAIDQHLIRGVDQRIADFFPEYADIFADGEKAKLRLQDLLAMAAGLDWDESTYPYTDPRNDHIRMYRGADPLRYVLERPLVAAPGTKFTYNSGLSITLGQILYKASGLRADKFADRYLFQPLGISDYYWGKIPDDIVQTGGGLHLRSRDMAKIGTLFVNGGRWQGKQIVSEAWVRQSTSNHIGTAPLPQWAQAAHGYGYQWWLGSFQVGDRTVPFYSARGLGGQFILVFPDQQMVAVVTGWNEGRLMNQPLDMMQHYVLPAVLP
jgi:CubicO group peptidase (beta-lactamase class C family)